MTSSTSAEAPSSSVPAATGYGRLARQISGWTTNLLATAIVLVAGVALGWQVLVWWREDGAEPFDLAAATIIPPEIEGREFWTSAGPLRIERLAGDEAAALAAMRAWCLASQPLAEVGEAGPGETRLLARLANQAPLEQTGDVALYRPPEEFAAGPLMLAAVSRSRGRIVAWSFALPAVHSRDQWSRSEAETDDALGATAGDGTRSVPTTLWSLYHFRPASPGAITAAMDGVSHEILKPTP